jgi:hypothetical protein
MVTGSKVREGSVGVATKSLHSCEPPLCIQTTPQSRSLGVSFHVFHEVKARHNANRLTLIVASCDMLHGGCPTIMRALFQELLHVTTCEDDHERDLF